MLITDDENTPLMIAPVQIIIKSIFFRNIGLRKGFYFIGRQGYSDYMNFVYKSFNPLIMDEILFFLMKRYGLKYFCFENVVKRCSAAVYLDKIKGISRVESVCMRIEFPDTFETYRRSLSKSVRQNIRTAFNRADRDGKVFNYEIIDMIDEKTADKLANIRNQRLKEKMKSSFDSLSPAGKAYIVLRNLLVKLTSSPIDVMNEIKKCWCFIVREHDEIAAFYFAVYQPENKTAYLLLAGVNKKYEWYSPGTAQLYSYIKDEIDAEKQQVEIFDLTRGNEKYKFDISAQEVITVCFAFVYDGPGEKTE